MAAHLDRRKFLEASCALMLPCAARSQPAQRVFRIGVLTVGIRPGHFLLDLLYDALHELGYEEGRNVVFDHLFAQGRQDRLPSLAAELVARKPDLILVPYPIEIQAARQATSTIPIVMCFGQIPVESGLVAPLVRPGGNVTGVAYDPEFAAKMFVTLREAMPRVTRAALLWDPSFPELAAIRQSSTRAAEAMGIGLTALPASSRGELESAFERITRDSPQALVVTGPFPAYQERKRVVAFTARQRLPAIYIDKGPVIDGGLMCLWDDVDGMLHQAAAIADRVLKGEAPAQIAVEYPKRIGLVVNLKTAKALGFTFPPSFLAKADEVIY